LHPQEKIDNLVLADLKVKLFNYSKTNMTKFIRAERDRLRNELTSPKINSTLLGKLTDELKKLEQLEIDVEEGLLPFKGKFTNIAEQQRSIKKNINRILLDNDELTIEYKFPIDKELNFQQTFSLL